MTTTSLPTTGTKPLLSQAQLAAAVQRYGLHIDEYGPIEKGYRNHSFAFRSGAAWYTVIIYKPGAGVLETIRRSNQLGAELVSQGLPVRSPADPRILHLTCQPQPGTAPQHRYASLYHYLPGETIPWEAYTMKHIKLLGWALADLHRAAKSSQVTAPSIATKCIADCETMHAYFSRPDVVQALQEKLNLRVPPQLCNHYRTFFRTLSATSSAPHDSLLHMDFVRGNILFSSSTTQGPWRIPPLTLSGVIDLEKVASGHPLIDIARTLAFLLVDCATKPETQIRKYFLYSGYKKRGKASTAMNAHSTTERDTYDILSTATTFFLLYDLYKFLRSNPYESLPENHHFVRTAALLAAKGLVTKTGP